MSNYSRYRSKALRVKALSVLPQKLFLKISGLTPLINVDLLIKDVNGRTLLTWRDDGYWTPGWHIPGGIIRFKERAEDRIQRTAQAELGAGVKTSKEPAAVNQFIHPSRRERGHFISLLYRCSLKGKPSPALQYRGGTPKPGQWAWHDGCPADLLEVHEVYREFI